MILIVDDDMGMAETCAMLLETHGFEVGIAASGAQALARIRQAAPELVITDCVMPGMSGPELSARLKADPLTARLPVLLMSGSLRCEVGKNASYDGFLRKPFLAENLLAEVSSLLAAARTADDRYAKV
ncbi:response regulator [Massilia antarctica]|uniref:Response regulator n=1 Tax=Massilia antarctica TaxID=2765360 RepID=A0AA48WBA0_9BURK|nr:response regulator [Massilia antarctica]QPI49298.1 response regulator [Massilia antarctica]